MLRNNSKIFYGSHCPQWFLELVYSKNRHVADVMQTRGESIYSFNNPQKYIVSSCHGFNFLPHYLSRAPTPHKGCLEAVRYPSGI